MVIENQRRTLLGAAGVVALTSVLTAGWAKPKERVIKVVARKFEFVPRELHVKKGETVILQFTAPEVPMGVNLPDFAQRIDILSGKIATMRLSPDKAGSFVFLCDVFCGSGHEDMSGTLVVT